MNCYGTLAAVKRILGETSTDNDADILQCLMAASRRIDGPCGANRFFYTTNATLFFGVQDRWESEIVVPDVLSVSAVTEDIDGDGTFSRTWTEGTHFSLSPDGGFPKMGIAALPWGDYAFSSKGRKSNGATLIPTARPIILNFTGELAPNLSSCISMKFFQCSNSFSNSTFSTLVSYNK